MKKFLKWFGIVLVIALIVFQFIPVDRHNPPVDSSKTLFASTTVPANVHSVLQRSCQDCHSSETRWPWYSHFAPVSWLLASDVHDGRKRMNLSEWGNYPQKKKEDKLDAICDMVSQNEMPPLQYRLIHRDSVLTQQDRDTLCQWTKTADTAAPGTAAATNAPK